MPNLIFKNIDRILSVNVGINNNSQHYIGLDTYQQIKSFMTGIELKQQRAYLFNSNILEESDCGSYYIVNIKDIIYTKDQFSITEAVAGDILSIYHNPVNNEVQLRVSTELKPKHDYICSISGIDEKNIKAFISTAFEGSSFAYKPPYNTSFITSSSHEDTVRTIELLASGFNP